MIWPVCGRYIDIYMYYSMRNCIKWTDDTTLEHMAYDMACMR